MFVIIRPLLSPAT